MRGSFYVSIGEVPTVLPLYQRSKLLFQEGHRFNLNE
jgi:hypothetical protein